MRVPKPKEGKRGEKAVRVYEKRRAKRAKSEGEAARRGALSEAAGPAARYPLPWKAIEGFRSFSKHGNLSTPMVKRAAAEYNPEDAQHCPMIVRQVHLKDLRLLESGRLRDYCLELATKRLAEAVAEADGRTTPTLKRVRNASSTSLSSIETAVVATSHDKVAVEAMMGLSKMAAFR